MGHRRARSFRVSLIVLTNSVSNCRGRSVCVFVLIEKKTTVQQQQYVVTKTVHLKSEYSISSYLKKKKAGRVADAFSCCSQVTPSESGAVAGIGAFCF